MTDIDYQKHVNQLIENVCRAEFKGYDPYDFANTTIKYHKSLGPKISFINKISPINFRKLLGIKPTYNSKANALILHSLINSDFNKYQQEIDFLISWFKKNRSTDFEEFAVGFSFNINLTIYSSAPGKTSLIISLFVMNAFVAYYNKTKNDEILTYILSFSRLLEQKWLSFEDETYLWYSYLPDQKEEIYNATAEVGKFYSNLFHITGDPKYTDKIKKIIAYLFSKQRVDGSWPHAETIQYSDCFHTLFVLDSILEMLETCPSLNYKLYFDKGVESFTSGFFDSKNKMLRHYHVNYRPKDIRSKLFDTEIRDYANAISFFKKLGNTKDVEEILQWLNIHLYSSSKQYYYFFKNKYFVNRINFIRWQAWMMYSLSVYLKANNNEKD